MKLSIVIPAYNEEKRLAKTLPRVVEYIRKFEKRHLVSTVIIVVNDGSSDNTLALLKKFESDIKVVSYDINMGKGYALRKGVEYEMADYTYIADADFSTPIEYIDTFYRSMTGYNCVIGSRAVDTGDVKVSFLRKLLGSIGNLAIRSILGLNFRDTQCGFKMFDKKAREYFLKCENNRWGYDFEFLYLLVKNDLKVKELPVEWNAVEDSKVKPLDYFRTLKELINVKKIHG